LILLNDVESLCISFVNIQERSVLCHKCTLALREFLLGLILSLVHAFVTYAVGRGDVAPKNIVFEVALLFGPVWENDPAPTVLDSAFPLTHVGGAVDPGELSEPLALLQVKLASVDVPRLAPLEDTVTVFSVIEVLALVAIGLGVVLLPEPLARSVFHASFELPFEERPVN